MKRDQYLLVVIVCLITFFFSLPNAWTQDNVLGDYILSRSDKQISMDLEGARLVDVLKAFSKQTGLNFISTEAVRDRKITLYFDNVSLKEALDILFKANNLTYDYYPDSNIFVVKEIGKPSIELKTKVYQLKNIWVQDSNISLERQNILVSNISLGKSGAGDFSNVGASTFGSVSASKIKEIIKSVLTKYGKVTVDPLTNSVIVTDVPAQFVWVDEVISKLDVPRPKVMIEVEMLDVSKRLIDKIGVDFGSGGYGLYAKYTGPVRKSYFPFPHRLRNSSLSNTVTTLGILDLSTAANILQILSSDSETKFLARPKILTLSNETAEVNLTVDEVVGLTTTSTQTTVTQNLEREDTGTILRVTPQVNSAAKEITMVVQVFNREAKDSGLSLSSLAGGELKNIEERGTKSVVRLKDGETLLIGGLIRQDKSKSKTKIPLLGDIPILKRFFSYDSNDNEERELMVFITPRIIEDRDISKPVMSLEREQNGYSREKSIQYALDKFSSQEY